MPDPSAKPPHRLIEDPLDRLRVQSLAALAIRQGLDQESARRVVQIVQGVLSKNLSGETSIAELRRNPSRVLSQVVDHGAVRLGDRRRRDAPGVTSAPTEDLTLLVRILLRAVGPRLATGRELCRAPLQTWAGWVMGRQT